MRHHRDAVPRLVRRRQVDDAFDAPAGPGTNTVPPSAGRASAGCLAVMAGS
jgi:hypothetical protein